MGNRCSRRKKNEAPRDPWTQDAIDSFVKAAGKNQVDKLKSILSDPSSLPAVDAKHSEFQINALMMAAVRGNVDAAKLILQEGAEPEMEDWRGWTPVFFAARYGRTGVLDVLLDYEAEVDLADIHGWTPLMVAAAYGHVDAIRTLLGSGADELARNAAGSTALQIAEEFSQDDCADALRQRMERVAEAEAEAEVKKKQSRGRRLSMFSSTPKGEGRGLKKVYSTISVLRKLSPTKGAAGAAGRSSPDSASPADVLRRLSVPMARSRAGGGQGGGVDGDGPPPLPEEGMAAEDGIDADAVSDAGSASSGLEARP